MNLRNWRRTSTCPQSVIALLAALALTFVGCTTVRVAPLEPKKPAQLWQEDELKQSLALRQEKFRSVRALARVNYSGPEGNSGFQEAVLVQRPDRLRLETLSLLGAILIVTVDDKEIIGYHPREGIMVRGERSKKNLLRYTQIPLELDEITSLLMGLPPVEVTRPLRQEGNTLVSVTHGVKTDAIAFESQHPVPTKWERFNGAGVIEMSALFVDYISTPSGLFPSKILVEAPLQGKKLEIRYQEPELNASIPSDLFSQQKPAHVKEFPIEALGG